MFIGWDATMHDVSPLDHIGDIYDCAIDPERWPETLGAIAKVIGGGQSVLIVQDPVARNCRLLKSWNVDPSMAADYMNNFVAIDPTLTLGWYREIDAPYSVVDALGEKEYTNSRLYKDWTRKYGFHDNLQTILDKSVTRYSGLSFLRLHGDGLYRSEDIAFLRQLVPHVRRAIAIGDLLDVRSLGHDLLSATLDALAVGIVIVDGKGRILHSNVSAARLMEERDRIRREGDFLSAACATCAGGLRSAIKAAGADLAHGEVRAGVAVPIEAGDGRDLAAWVLPLDRGLRGELAAPLAARVAIFIREIGNTSPFPGELFVKRYGISPAECRVLMILTQGKTPSETADVLGLTLSTVKTHMARLFEKTQTSGQADLMRIAISALSPVIDPPAADAP